MQDLEVIEDPAAAYVAVEPIKSKILAALAEPASAATLTPAAPPRQKVNYHLRSLEDYGLVRISEKRLWGGSRSE